MALNIEDRETERPVAEVAALGDRLIYAVASLAGQPLLYVGEDFARSDLSRA